jgi:hypothetical protein
VVDRRTDELVDEIAMARMDLDPIEARSYTPLGCVDKSLDDPCDVGLRRDLVLGL